MVSASTLTGLGFIIGALFGCISLHTRFCTSGAIADAVILGDHGRLRMWMLAMAVAILGTTALQLGGLFDSSYSGYTGSRLPWLSHLVGGALFGIGMTLSSGCGARVLTRIGGGNLKALVVFLVLALSATMTQRGVLSPLRQQGLNPVHLNLPHGQDLPAFIAATGLSAEAALLLAASTAAGLLLLGALLQRQTRWREMLPGGLAIGALIAAGWYVTGHFGFSAEDEIFIASSNDRAESLSFVGPLAYSLDLLMFWNDPGRIFSFGIASVLGVIVGAMVYSLLTGNFRLEGFRDTADLTRHLIGAVLMGFGGITAQGCTIGQGLTGLSTLALGSLLTTVAIIAGAALSLKLQYHLLERQA